MPAERLGSGPHRPIGLDVAPALGRVCAGRHCTGGRARATDLTLVLAGPGAGAQHALVVLGRDFDGQPVTGRDLTEVPAVADGLGQVCGAVPHRFVVVLLAGAVADAASTWAVSQVSWASRTANPTGPASS